MDLDPLSQAIVDAINASGVVPFRQFTPIEAREQILKLRQPRPAIPTHPMAEITEEFFDTREGSVRVRILRPRDRRDGELMPAVIYFHGGGFFAGGLDETDLIVRQIAKDADVVVFNVEYRLSPEYKFPTAVNDAYRALEWVAAEAPRLGIDPARIIMAGDSAGGNLTIVTSLQVRERGGPPIAYQVVIYPSLDLRARPSYPSRVTLGSGQLFLMNDDIEWMLDHYFTDRAEGDDWRASPIVAADFAGLPPALVVTASHDPLVDEGKLYADRLQRDGVPVEYARFEGTFHGFVSMAMVLPTGARAMELICDRIKREAWCPPND